MRPLADAYEAMLFGISSGAEERTRKSNEAVQKGLSLAKGLLAAGSAVPGIGSVCTAAQNALGAVEKINQRHEDLVLAAEKVANVLELLQMLSVNVKNFDPNTKQQIESHMNACATAMEGIKKVCEVYGKAGFIKRSMQLAKSGTTLIKFDKQINMRLEALMNIYTVAKDQRVEQMLAERNYPMERAVEEKVAQAGPAEVVVDENLVREIASKMGLDQSELNAEVQSLAEEVKEFRGETQQNFDDLKQMMAQSQQGNAQVAASISAAATDAAVSAAVTAAITAQGQQQFQQQMQMQAMQGQQAMAMQQMQMQQMQQMVQQSTSTAQAPPTDPTKNRPGQVPPDAQLIKRGFPGLWTWILSLSLMIPFCFCPLDEKEVWIDPQGKMYDKTSGSIIPPDPMDCGQCHPKPPPAQDIVRA